MARVRRSNRSRRDKRRGVLTLEWILVITVLVIGVIGGLGAVRLALVSELHDLAGAVEALHVAPPEVPVDGFPVDEFID